MYEDIGIRKLRGSQTAKRILFCLLFALLIVQWGLIQHIESHLFGHNSDNCQLCLAGDHMANAVAITAPSTPVVPAQSPPQTPVSVEFWHSPLISFLVRAPPLSKI
jgi:hypothetical protein